MHIYIYQRRKKEKEKKRRWLKPTKLIIIIIINYYNKILSKLISMLIIFLLFACKSPTLSSSYHFHLQLYFWMIRNVIKFNLRKWKREREREKNI